MTRVALAAARSIPKPSARKPGRWRHALVFTALLVCVGGGVLAASTTAGADAVCNDGWYSRSSGQGTCSWHGGVDYWVAAPGSGAAAPVPLTAPPPIEHEEWIDKPENKALVGVVGFFAITMIWGDQIKKWWESQ